MNSVFTKKHIFFICNSLETNIMIGLQNAVSSDERFTFTIVSSECIGTTWSPGYSQQHVEEGLQAKGLEFVSGESLDLFDLRGAIFLTTTPYDVYLPDKFKSENLIKIGYLVNIRYGIHLLENSGLYAEEPGSNPYLERCSFIFVEEDSPFRLVKTTRVGSAKVFFYKELFKSIRIERSLTAGAIISWKPRWTLNFDSTIFQFMPELEKLLSEFKYLQLILVEHPLLRQKLRESRSIEMFENWESTMFETGRYSIASGDNSLTSCYKSDILIADISSTIYEFSFTGKPILYTSPKVPLNKYGKRITNACYKISSAFELRDTLIMLLNGKDPLRNKRFRLAKKQQNKLGKPYELILNHLFQLN